MSALVVRALPPEEWTRLKGTGMDLAQVQDASTLGTVIVVEEHHNIVACGVVLLCAHLEGLWIHPDSRGRFPVVRRLWQAIKDAVWATGAKGVCSSAVTDQSEGMILRMGGVPLDGHQFVTVLRGAR